MDIELQYRVRRKRITVKVYINPHPNLYEEDGRGSGGIWRVILAQAKHFPKYGIEVADDIDKADIVIAHAGAIVNTDKPIIQNCHGYYWTGDFNWRDEYWAFNSAVIELSRRASRIVVPSQWVAYPIRRDMRRSPVVIPHGVDFENFKFQQENKGYVLWAKPRVDVVSDPTPMNELARRATNIPFLSTYGQPTGNVTVLGAKPYHTFQEILEGALIWLSTTRETGDIASREAMARGIPVLGWDWGATGELIKHKETGYLAKQGDYDDLLEGLHYCIDNRERLRQAAREDIRERFQWRQLIGRYSTVLEDTLKGSVYPADVSIIVPSYNYAHFLPECLESIKSQQFSGTTEVIVVDDASTDDTQSVLSRYTWPELSIIRHQSNRGLCATLNSGYERAQGKYGISLDADNLFPPSALQTLYDALEEEPWLDVASGGLAMYSGDGEHRKATDWPLGRVDVGMQLDHYNQLPSSSMVRMRNIRRIGGYRERQIKNEDGEFWCRAMSAGLRFKQVTKEPVLVYRWHEHNKSKLEGGEDNPEGPLSWNFYYPWRVFSNITPFAMTGSPAKGSWPVRSYDRPHVAVIIPCGPGHERFVMDALDSVAAQTYCNIECIIGNDTGSPLDVAKMGHPWVKVVDTPGATGPAIARNVAIEAARAPLIVPLDADDMLYPNCIANYYEAWLQYPDSIVYGDCDIEDKPGMRRDYHCGDFSFNRVTTEAVYQDTILFPKQWWRAVGGYEPTRVWEDWLFGVKLHLMGIGATYVKKPWGVYRHWTTLFDGRSKNQKDTAGYGTPEFQEKVKYAQEWIAERDEKMARKCCGGRARAHTISGVTIKAVSGPERVFVYDGPMGGYFSVNSAVVPGKKFRVRRGEPFTVSAGDAEYRFSRMKDFLEVLPEEMGSGTSIPNDPPQVPVLEIPGEIPPPPTVKKIFADNEEDDLDLLGLPDHLLDKLEKAGFKKISDLRRDIETNGGEGIKRVHRVGPSRYVDIAKAVMGE